MDDYRIIPVDESFNSRILSILGASPIEAGGLTLHFDKSPDIFTISRMKYPEAMHLGIVSGADLVGFASMGFYNALVKGKEECISTFYNFFILPKARGHRLSERVLLEFKKLAVSKSRFAIAITLRGNRPVESYLQGNNDSELPPARIIDSLCVKSILFSIPRSNRSEYKVRNATPEDIPEIVKLLNGEHSFRDFGTVFREETFTDDLQNRKLSVSDYYLAESRNGFIKGVCLAWDCTSFRRTRLIKASPGLLPFISGYKALSRVFPMAPFPEPGNCFSELTITDYAVEGRNIQIMNALLSEIYFRNRNGKYHFMNFGSCLSDSLLKAAGGFWFFNNISHIAFSEFNRNSQEMHFILPYIDIAYL